MKKFFVIIGVAIAVILTAVPVLASTITGATYVGTVTLTNTSTAATNVAVPFTLSTSNLINYHYVNSTFDNSSMQFNGVDTAYMPARTGQTTWMVWATPVPGGSSSAKLYTGGAAMNGKLRYFPDTGGMTAVDNAALELGDNFKVEQKGFIDTAAGASKYLVYKLNAFYTYVSGAGVITSYINAGSNTSPTAFDSGAGWANTANAYDNNLVTLANYSDFGGGASSALTLSRAATVCNQVTYKTDSISSTLGTVDVDVYYGAAWHDVYAGADVAGTFTKNLPTYPTTQSCTKIRIVCTGTGFADNYYVYELYFTNQPFVTTAMATGEHTITTTADGTDLKLYVDTVLKDTSALNGVSVPDNANNWAFLENLCVPYMEYHKIYIPGNAANPEQSIAWENGATFTDLSGNGHTATPTFKTTSTDADVSAALTAFVANKLSSASGYSVGGSVSFITTLPDDTGFPSGGVYNEGNTGGIIGADLVNEGLTTADIPEPFFWYPIAFLVSIVLGFVAYGLTKTLLVQAIVSGVVMACFCGGGVLGDGLLPWFTVVIFGIEAAMVIVIQEKFAV
jgi:hypothetical protein